MTSLLHRTTWFIRKNVWKIIICIRKGFDIRLALLCAIDVETVPKSIIFAHPFGIVIRGGTVMGEGCKIRQHVTIGTRQAAKGGEIVPSPRLGNYVDIGANAIIIGDVFVGDNAKIGADAVILKDVSANNAVVGIYK